MKMRVMLVVLGCLLAGCVSTPITGIVVSRELDRARSLGWKQVCGTWVPPEVQVPELRAGAKLEDILAYDHTLKSLAAAHGRSDWSVALTLNPWGVRLAQVADGVLISGAAAGILYLAEGLDRDGQDTSNNIRVAADRGSVVQIGNRDASSARTSHEWESDVEHFTAP